MTTTISHRSASTAGFTITELMVAMSIMAIVVTQLMMVLTTQNKTYSNQERILDAQQDARIATELILSDLRMGGFLIPTVVGLSSVDGGPNAPDVVCASDPSFISEASIANSSGRFDRAKTNALVGGASINVTLDATTMDVDIDNDDDFVVNGGIIISDGNGSHCGRITNIIGNLLTFTPATQVGFTALRGPGRAVPAIIYEITPNGLARNGVLLSPLVENLQIEFGIDANLNGQLDAGEFPVHDLVAAGADPSQIITARLSLIARTNFADPDFSGAGMSPTANHVGTPPDGFKRRRITANISPRNLR